ncbi:MAG TPA: type VI secretion system baseplate subunit TssG [Planctomycetaceae bacterium]|nr:type VI secretion system baseplate subunit TssG [Planctomycetaceae bacterium]|tara:strand:+ start:31429 stop:32511 length:1083 start_codon:yes stop_codon:yes gene_type:complete
MSQRNSALFEQLEQHPERFDFFQAVRLLRLAAAANDKANRTLAEDFPPAEELVRFRTLVSQGFPESSISQFSDIDDDDGPPCPAEMTVSFLGLVGPSGVLPAHYTTLLIERMRQKDFALRDFLDIFHHRLIAWFYRAWEKYRFPIAYERQALNPEPQGDDLFTRCLLSLVGMGTDRLQNRQQLDDRNLLYFAGHFAHAPRNAINLESSVTELFEVPARVCQFEGQWLYLPATEQSQLTAAEWNTNANNQLGVCAVAGTRVWSVENRIRIQLGPLDYETFCEFSPMGSQRWVQLAEFVRTYIGPAFDFDIQPVLRSSEIPRCQLGGKGIPARLGWNTWLTNADCTNDASDAIFLVEDHPLC